MKLMLACGQLFEGTLEELKALKATNPEMFVAPTATKGQGTSNRTETEKDMWNKGRIFGLIYSTIIAEEKLNAALNGKEDLGDFDKALQKQILVNSSMEKIQAKCKALNLDFEYYKKCWEYKKDCEKKSKK